MNLKLITGYTLAVILFFFPVVRLIGVLTGWYLLFDVQLMMVVVTTVFGMATLVDWFLAFNGRKNQHWVTLVFFGLLFNVSPYLRLTVPVAVEENPIVFYLCLQAFTLAAGAVVWDYSWVPDFAIELIGTLISKGKSLFLVILSLGATKTKKPVVKEKVKTPVREVPKPPHNKVSNQPQPTSNPFANLKMDNITEPPAFVRTVKPASEAGNLINKAGEKPSKATIVLKDVVKPALELKAEEKEVKIPDAVATLLPDEQQEAIANFLSWGQKAFSKADGLAMVFNHGADNVFFGELKSAFKKATAEKDWKLMCGAIEMLATKLPEEKLNTFVLEILLKKAPEVATETK